MTVSTLADAGKQLTWLGLALTVALGTATTGATAAGTAPKTKQHTHHKRVHHRSGSVAGKTQIALIRKSSKSHSKTQITARPNADDNAEDESARRAQNSKSGESPSERSEKAGASPIAPAPVESTASPTSPSAAADSRTSIADAALVSVLKDVAKSLQESDDVKKLTDPAEREAMTAATNALVKSLSLPSLESNRIITGGAEAAGKRQMVVEAWQSGDIALSPDSHVSASAVWAKKPDGMLNISIAGSTGSDSAPAREFLVVLDGTAAVESGFDIQSQANVTYWIGKLKGFHVEASQSGATPEKKSHFRILTSPVTVRQRLQLSEIAKQVPASDKKPLEKTNSQSESQSLTASVQQQKGEIEQVLQSQRDKLQADLTDLRRQAEAAFKQARLPVESLGAEPQLPDQTAPAKTSTEPSTPSQPVQPAPQPAATAQAPAMPIPARAIEAAPLAATAIRSMHPMPATTHRGAWNTAPAATPTRTPPAHAALVVPDRAVAGQYMTMAVVGSGGAAEPFIELTLNGACLSTGSDGKVSYMVPEDAPSGPSILVGLTARPELIPLPIHVLQPLSIPASMPAPTVDRVSELIEVSTPLVLSGHNFSGNADQNRVIIDGDKDATVVAASPVQLKATLPSGLSLGRHHITVTSTSGKSNAATSEVIAVQIDPAGSSAPKKDSRRLFVRVVGTESKVKLKVLNLTPSVVKLAHGDEQILWTPGGSKNEIMLPVHRLQDGDFRVSARLQGDGY